jgi:hypothetical protein
MLPAVIINGKDIDELWLQVAHLVTMHNVAPSCLVELDLDAEKIARCLKKSPIQELVDKALSDCKKPSIRASALTIFPYELWQRRKQMSCDDFSRLCVDRLLPKMKERNPNNKFGTYFERIMDYDRDHTSKGQLTRIVEEMKYLPKRPRESMLQLAIYDPRRDLSRMPRRGFPCLQQISISYGSGREFCLNAVYPVQYIFDRAYGNYLGLHHLGEFIAEQTGWDFRRLSTFVISPKLGSITKAQLIQLLKTCKHKRIEG